MRILRFFIITLCFIFILAFGLWAGLALYFQGIASLKWVIVALWGVFICLTLWGLCRSLGRKRALVSFMLGAVGLLTWWSLLTPRLDRDWQPQLANTVTGQIDGNLITLNNVRNFDWASSTDYTPKWETRSYNLDQLQDVDMILSYWGDEAIAHTLISFGFTSGEYVTFSVEIRKEVGEDFSTIGGFFKNYELALLAADENDIVRLRTNARDPLEDVYLYPLITTPEHRVALFKGYIEKANELAAKPSFYNTITANCTTVIYGLVKQFRDDITLDKRIIWSGYLPDYMADRDALRWQRPYGDIRAKAAISAKALAIKEDENYSVVIRR
jgi:hypothetical protein